MLTEEIKHDRDPFVESFNGSFRDERLKRWFPGPREIQRHLVVVSPLVQRLRDEFAPVVALDALRHYTAQRFDSMPFRFWPTSISRHSR